MQELFLELIKLSLIGSLFALAVMAVRLTFQKAPKWIFCVLWGIVALRLIVPISIESDLSLVPDRLASGQIITNVGSDYIGDVDIFYESNAGYSNAVEAGRQPIYSNDGYYVVTEKDSLEAPKTVGETIYPVLSWVWFAGMVLMLIYSAISYILLKLKMEEATLLRDNIWQCEDADSPFVLGIIRPRIYLPYAITEPDMENVIAHEQAHIQRKDHWWKPIGFLLLSIHWFNPVMWLAYILLCRDIEAACDEKVIKHMEKDEKRAYSTALLHCSVHRRRIAACPLAFGEVGVKERIKRVMNYKKPAFWNIVLTVITCVVLAVCFLTDPSEDALHAPEPFGHSYRVEEVLYREPQVSFTYTTDNAARYQFTSDYAMFVFGDILDDSESLDWVQQHGKFEEVRITTQNFNDYFMMASGLSTNDTLSQIVNGIDQAWRINVDNNEHGLFYYLIITKTDDVYLTHGYDINNSNDLVEDGSRISWLFKLARTDIISCNAISEGLDAFVELEYVPEGIDHDAENWPVAQVNNSGTLIFNVDYDTNALIISEDYYHRNGDVVEIEKDRYELGRNEDGVFALDVSRRSGVEDSVNYFIKIKGKTDVYVLKVVFETDEDNHALWNGDLVPGTTYVPYQCIYMNPLSSYAAMGGDSGCKYIVGEDYFATVWRDDSNFINVTHPDLDTAADNPQNIIEVSKWEWLEFPYTDEEWASLYWPDGFNSIEKISDHFDKMYYQPLTPDKFLLKMDESLWLVELSIDSRVGTYIWSIYSLVPESAMGFAQWEYAPMLSSRLPVFRFEFNMEYTQITAVCDEGMLVDWDTQSAPSGTSMTFQSGNALYWSPSDEDGITVSSAKIQLLVYQGDTPVYHGTIYLEGNSGDASRRIYNASLVGTGLHLDPNYEIGGGVISRMRSLEVVTYASKFDLTTGNLEITAEELANYVFYTNSEQISVTVKSNGGFEGDITLLDISQNNAEIMFAEVNNGKESCLFQGLTSAKLYRIDCNGLDGCTVVISG